MGKLGVPGLQAWVWGIIFGVIAVAIVFRAPIVRRWVIGSGGTVTRA